MRPMNQNSLRVVLCLFVPLKPESSLLAPGPFMV